MNNFNINKPKQPIEETIVNNEPDISFDVDDFDFASDILIAKNPEDESQNKKTIENQSPKDTLIKFLQTSELDQDYTFTYNGSYQQAESFIQRMRVALSRFRAAIIKLNKPLNHFYVLTKSITVESEDVCTIVLLKSKQRKKPVESKLTSVLDYLSL